MSSTETRTFAALVSSPTEQRFDEVLTEADLLMVDGSATISGVSDLFAKYILVGRML